MNLRMLKARYPRLFRAPEPGDDGAGVVDRGDDFTPTEDEPAPKPEPKVEKPVPKDKAAALKELGKGGDDGDLDPEDPDGELTEEEKAAAVAAAAAGKKKDTRIPLARHKEILDRERAQRAALETQLKGYQGQQVVVQTNDAITTREAKVTELNVAYNKALSDGEYKEAADMMAQIRKLDREIMTLESDSKIAVAEARATENARYNIALERIEQAYPALDENSDEYDEGTYKEVVLLMRAYRAVGLTPTEALQKAVKKELGAEGAKQAAVTSVKPRVDEGDVAAQVRAERKAAATDKALKAKDGSPATAVAKTGINSNAAGAARSAADVIKMSQKDFAALDEKELARLRGDEVTS